MRSSSSLPRLGTQTKPGNGTLVVLSGFARAVGGTRTVTQRPKQTRSIQASPSIAGASRLFERRDVVEQHDAQLCPILCTKSIGQLGCGRVHVDLPDALEDEHRQAKLVQHAGQERYVPSPRAHRAVTAAGSGLSRLRLRFVALLIGGALGDLVTNGFAARVRRLLAHLVVPIQPATGDRHRIRHLVIEI